MGRKFVSGSSQYCEATISNFTLPRTVACWIKPLNLTANHPAFCAEISGNSSKLQALICQGVPAGDPVRAATQDGATVGKADSSAFASGTWQHIAARWDSSSSRAVFLNGTKTTNTTTAAPTGFDRLRIGARKEAGVYSSCTIAYACIWETTALTDGEITELQTKLPTEVQPGNIWAYYRFYDDDLDGVNSNHLTPRNSPTFEDDSAVSLTGGGGTEGAAAHYYQQLHAAVTG